MHETVVVDMCVSVRTGCPIIYLVTADRQVEFSFGGLHSGLHYAFDTGGLRSFLKVGADALAELEAQLRLEQVNGTTGTREPVAEAHAG